MGQFRRRQILIASGVLLAIPGVALSQSRTYRLAFLGVGSAQVSLPYQKVFFNGLAALGYHEGRNLVVDRRLAGGNLDRLPALANELVVLKPDLIVTMTTPATLATLKATRTIPIVFVGVGDPVGTGIVESLARPNRNATGTSANNRELHAKQLQLLKEMLPGTVRVAVLLNPLNPVELQYAATLKAEAPGLGLSLQLLEIESEAGLSNALKSIEVARPDVLYIMQSVFALTHRARIMEFANRTKLPVVSGGGDFPEGGGLMSYHSNANETFRLAATQVAKILEGAKPADLPVEQASVFELVVNLKTAKTLGITIPQSILLRADRVIE